jgi:hypothetical protein
MTLRRISVRPFLALAVLGPLGGCGTVENLIPHGDATAVGLMQGANPRPVAQPTANPSEKQVLLPVSSADINCPEVDVAEGRAAYRVGGADNASVRYQFNLSEKARECDPAGPGQAAIKVGVAGNLVIGPAGSGGTYSVPLHVTVTSEADNKPVFSKVYKIEASSDGASPGAFRIVTDPIVVPMTTLQLANVYSISVGLEGGAGATPRVHKRKKASG